MAGDVAKMLSPSRKRRASWLMFCLWSLSSVACPASLVSAPGDAGVRCSHSTLRGTHVPIYLPFPVLEAGRPQPAELALHFRPPAFFIVRGPSFGGRAATVPNPQPPRPKPARTVPARVARTHLNPASPGLPTQPSPANRGRPPSWFSRSHRARHLAAPPSGSVLPRRPGAIVQCPALHRR